MRRILPALLLCLTVSSAASAQIPSPGVFTYHNDPARTGQNVNETILTPITATSTTFGKLFADPVDGQLYAQPLYVANVAIPAQGIHNVVYAATENDTVYAFDADVQGAPLWQTSLLVNGGTPVPSSDLPPYPGEGTSCTVVVPVIGVTGTPVIDPTTNTLYVVAKTKEGPPDVPAYVQRLHALDLATGAEKFGGPVTIAATVPGTGDGSDGTTLTFDPLHHLNRPGLALVNGVVYVAFGSLCDDYPFHGWLFGYDAGLLTQVGVFVTTPNGGGGGVWQSGGSVAADAGNNLYVMTGNGTFDADQGGVDFGDSVLELSPATLTVADSFTPFDQATWDPNDLDLGSGAPVVLPDQSDAATPWDRPRASRSETPPVAR